VSHTIAAELPSSEPRPHASNGEQSKPISTGKVSGLVPFPAC
jgi:hypothetical protein